MSPSFGLNGNGGFGSESVALYAIENGLVFPCDIFGFRFGGLLPVMFKRRDNDVYGDEGGGVVFRVLPHV